MFTGWTHAFEKSPFKVFRFTNFSFVARARVALLALAAAAAGRGSTMRTSLQAAPAAPPAAVVKNLSTAAARAMAAALAVVARGNVVRAQGGSPLWGASATTCPPSPLAVFSPARVLFILRIRSLVLLGVHAGDAGLRLARHATQPDVVDAPTAHPRPVGAETDPVSRVSPTTPGSCDVPAGIRAARPADDAAAAATRRAFASSTPEP